MPAKTKLEQLKGNVEAQESRLEAAVKILNESKDAAIKSHEGQQQMQRYAEFDALERVVGLMGDLLTSYHTYTLELEKRVKWLNARAFSEKDDE